MLAEQSADLAGLIRFIETIGKLKRVKRQGWLDRGVKNAESVAEHSMLLAVMAFVFAKRLGLSECRALKLAIVHDLPEAIAGDVAVRIKEELQRIPNKKKLEMEKKALEELCKMLDTANAKELKELWREFEERKTGEAKLVYELDRLEAIFQALEYERKGNFRVSLQEFFDFADARIAIPELRAIFEKLMEKRQKNRLKTGKH